VAGCAIPRPPLSPGESPAGEGRSRCGEMSPLMLPLRQLARLGALDPSRHCFPALHCIFKKRKRSASLFSPAIAPPTR